MRSGLSAEELAALPQSERARLREQAAVELRDADMVIDSIADLPRAVAAIDARLAKGSGRGSDAPVSGATCLAGLTSAI